MKPYALAKLYLNANYDEMFIYIYQPDTENYKIKCYTHFHRAGELD